MTTKDDGGPAFPRDYRYDGHNGMTRRQLLAMAAMQAIITNPRFDPSESARVPEFAYAMADLMIAGEPR